MASSGYSGASKRKRRKDKKKVPQSSIGHKTSMSFVEDPVTAVSNVEKLGTRVVLENGSLGDGSPQVQDGSAVLEIQTESHLRTREVPQDPLNCSNCSSSKLKTKPTSDSVKAKKGTPLPAHNLYAATTTPQSTVGVTVTNCSTFEQELDWCIGQLRLGLMRPNAKKHQKEENERYIKTLSSSKTPLPKKRQIMRNLFGDYRANMKTHPILESPKEPEISCVEKDSLELTGKFYKFSAALAHKAIKSELKSDDACRDSKNLDRTTCHTASDGFGSDGRGFCFNFEIDSLEC